MIFANNFFRARSAELDIESLDIKVSKSKKKSSRQEEAEEEDFFADMAPDIKKREEGREEIDLDKEEETPEEEKAEDKGPTIAPSRYKHLVSQKAMNYESLFKLIVRFAVVEAMVKAEESEAAETAEGGGGWGDWGGDDDDGIVF